MIRLYELNIVHRLFHMVDWKFLKFLLKFSCLEKKKFEKMKNFVDSLCDYDYSSVKDKKCSNEEAAIAIETDMSVPVSYTVIN